MVSLSLYIPTLFRYLKITEQFVYTLKRNKLLKLKNNISWLLNIVLCKIYIYKKIYKIEVLIEMFKFKV